MAEQEKAVAQVDAPTDLPTEETLTIRANTDGLIRLVATQAAFVNVTKDSTATNIFSVNAESSDRWYKVMSLQQDGVLAIGGKDGGGLKLRENVPAARQGEATLAAGKVTVQTTAIGSTVDAVRVFLTRHGVVPNAGILSVDFNHEDQTFTIKSANAKDAGKVFWFLTTKASEDPSMP